MLIGIVSYGPGLCGNKKDPAIYTNVAHYMKWINSIVLAWCCLRSTEKWVHFKLNGPFFFIRILWQDVTYNTHPYPAVLFIYAKSESIWDEVLHMQLCVKRMSAPLPFQERLIWTKKTYRNFKLEIYIKRNTYMEVGVFWGCWLGILYYFCKMQSRFDTSQSNFGHK